jgi:hypothetical protein
MSFEEKLEIGANITAIFTFIGVAGAWCLYQLGFRKRRKELERCLEEDGKPHKERGEPGEFNFLHIMTNTGLTKAEILRASYKNPRISRRERPDTEGYAKDILFKYNDRK